jgi:hypothetical protein
MSFTEIVAENGPSDVDVVRVKFSVISCQFSVNAENRLVVAESLCLEDNAGTFPKESKNACNPPVAHFERYYSVGRSMPLGSGALRRHH